MNGDIKKLSNYPVTLANGVYLPNSNTKIWNFCNKKLLALGDSITESGYPQLLQAMSGIICTNRGSSGGDSSRLRKIVFGTDGWTAPIFTEYNICIIMIGHNDSYITEDRTSINDINGISDYRDYPNTYFGNVCACVEHILTQNNLIKLFLMTPITSINGVYQSRTPIVTNNLKIIADYYKLPIIDLHNRSGINKFNLNYYTNDGTHPNKKGNEVICKFIIKELMNL